MKRTRYIFLLGMALLLFWLPAGCQSDASPQTTTGETASLADLSSMPLEQALANRQPTVAEFGRGTCIPCKQMKPILEELAKEYKGKVNVLIISVDEYRDLTRQHGIMAIPTQIFFNSEGQEVTRHVGFYAKDDIIAQFQTMEIE